MLVLAELPWLDLHWPTVHRECVFALHDGFTTVALAKQNAKRWLHVLCGLLWFG
jgi:hypothetical protein